MSRSKTGSGKLVTLIALLAVLTAGAPAPGVMGADPAPSPTASASPEEAPSAPASPEPTPAEAPEIAAPSAMGRMDAGATGSIEVTVTVWSTGATPTGGCVEAYDAAGAVAGSSCSPAMGVFTIDGLAAGAYTVRAYNFTGMAPIWSGPANSRASATSITVVDGEVAPLGIRVVPPYSAVGKVVTGTGQAVVGGVVDVWGLSQTTPLAQATVGADGTYVLTTSACTTGGCTVRYVATPGHPESWYRNAVSPGGGSTQLVTAPSSVKFLLDQVLTASPATISGTITAPSYFTSGTVCMVLFGTDTGRPNAAKTFGVECGAPGDPFEFQNLPALRFGICAVDAASAPQGCGTATQANVLGGPFEPTTLLAVAGSTTTFPITFGATLSLTMRLGSLTGPFASDGCAELWTDDGALVSVTCGPVGGALTMPVANDSVEYRVRLRDVEGGAETWPYGKPGSTATGLWVGDGVTTFRTVMVDLAGTVSGTIALPPGSIATYGCVQAWDVRGTYTPSAHAPEACADPATGAYALTLPPGDYRLEYYAPTTDVASRWSGNSPDSAHADVIHVTTGSAKTINVALVAGGSITATLDDSSGFPVVSGCLQAVNSTGEIAVIRCLDGSHSVVLDSLAPGTYALYFEGNETVAPEWLGGADFGSSQRVTVAAGATTPVQITPDPLGTLQVTVTGPGATAAHGGCVTAFDAATGSYAGERCADAGNVVTMGLPAGSYRLFASGWFGPAEVPLSDSWWGGSSLDTATAVSVSVSAPADVSLGLAANGGTIAVTTTYWSRTTFVTSPATGGCVRAYTETTDLAGIACAADGESSVDLHVPAGAYRLQFSDFTANDVGTTVSLATSWSGGAPAFATAASVAVQSGSATSYAASLNASSRVTGVATLSGTPIAGGVAELYRESTGDLVASSAITGSGQYSFENLTPGDNVVLFVRDVPGVADQYYHFPVGVAGLSSSTSRTVPPGSSMTWDIALAQSGSLSGVIAAPPTLAAGEICVRVWRPLNGYWPVGTAPTNWEFVAEECGQRGDAFNFPALVSGSYGVEYADSSGGGEWYQMSQPYGMPDIVMVYTGQNTVLPQRTLDLWAPSEFVWGQTIPVVVSQLHPHDMQVTATLTSWTDWTGPSTRTVTLNFIDGYAVVWLPTSASDRGNGTLFLSLSAGANTTRAVGVTSVAPHIELAMPSEGVAGTKVTASIAVDPALSGTATVWFRSPGGFLQASGNRFAVTNGSGSTTITVPTSATFYAIEFGGGLSNEVELTPAPPVVNLTGSASFVAPGTAQQVTVSTSPGWSGVAELWIQSTVGGAWVKSTRTIQVTNGTGSLTVYPSSWTSMRVAFMGETSDPITFTPITPVVTLSGSTSFVQPGTALPVTLSVSPAASGVAELWVQTEVDGPWVKSAQTIQVTNGTGSVTLRPSKWTSVRVVLFGVTSAPVTFTPVPPVVTLSGPTSFVQPGSAQRVDVAVSPSMSGIARLWVQSEPGGPWTESDVTVQITNGSASLTLNPVRWTSVKVVLFDTSSDPLTFTPVVPSVTLAGPTTFEQPGTAQRVTVSVDPSISGIGEVWIQTAVGGAWSKSAMTVQVANGAGSLTVNPASWTSFRVVLFGTSSDPLTMAPVVPTVTLSGSTSFVQPGAEQRVTVAVAPSISGVGEVWLQSQPDGPWSKSPTTVTVKNGSGSVALNPTGTTSVRVVLFGTASNTATLTLIPPVLTVSGSAEFTQPGSPQQLMVTADHPISGVAELWVQDAVDGPWVKSGMTVTVVNGVGTATLYPSRWTAVRVVLFGVTSGSVTYAPAVAGP